MLRPPGMHLRVVSMACLVLAAALLSGCTSPDEDTRWVRPRVGRPTTNATDPPSTAAPAFSFTLSPDDTPAGETTEPAAVGPEGPVAVTDPPPSPRPVPATATATTSRSTSTPPPATSASPARTVNHAPFEPAAPEPISGAVSQPLSVTLHWTGGDPDGDPVQYQVTVNNVIRCSGPNTSCTLTGLLPGVLHTWHVATWDVPAGLTSMGQRGPDWTFRTQNEAPSVASAPYPPDGGTVYLGSENPVTLRWNATDPEGQALQYLVKLAEGTNPPPWDRCLWTYETRCTTNVLTPDKTYYWKVDVKDSGGVVTPGPVWSFRTSIVAPP